MEVSNTTNADTQYKVSGASGSPENAPGPSRSVCGHVPPHDYAVVVPPPADAWKVEFFREGKLVATKHFGNPKASLVLSERQGKLQVQASVAPLDAFISYASAETQWAEELQVALERNGLAVWRDARSLEPGDHWRDELGKAIAKAKNVILLVGPRAGSEMQRFEWQVALDAAWQDPNKRLIPFLLGDAEVPTFLRSLASGVVAIRVADPRRDWSRTVAVLVEVLKSEADLRTRGQALLTTDRDRQLQQERLSYIRQVAPALR